MRFRPLSFSLFVPLLLAGCGITSTSPETVSSAAVHGQVYGGQQPVSGSSVQIWQAGTGYYGGSGSTAATVLATTTTGSGGTFTFATGSYTCTTGSQVYITATGGNAGLGYNNPNILLAAGLGSCTSAQNFTVNINEVTTVATAFALSHFFGAVGSGGDYFTGPTSGGLANANQYTIPTLVNIATGVANASTSTITTESAKINSMANTLAACVNDSSTFPHCTQLYGYTQNATAMPGSQYAQGVYSTAKAANTLEAAVQMALYPFNNVSALWSLGTSTPPFVGLSAAPSDWTIGVSYKTASLGLGIAGTATSGTSSNIDIDTNGRVWFPSNQTGAIGAAYFDPATNTFSSAYGGSSLVHPQYLALNPASQVFVSDLGSANVVNFSSTAPATITATNTVTGVGGPLAIYYDSTVYLGSTASGTSYLNMISSAGTLTPQVEAFKNGVPNSITMAAAGSGKAAAGIIAATSGSSTVCADEFVAPPGNGQGITAGTYLDSKTASGTTCYAGGAVTTGSSADQLIAATTTNQICSDDMGTCFSAPVALTAPEGIAVDGDGFLWVANSSTGSLSVFYSSTTNAGVTTLTAFGNSPYLHGASNGSTMTTPYGIAIDRSGNVWTSNASCVTTTATACTPSGFVLSEVIGAAFPTQTPLSVYTGGYQGYFPATSVTPPATLAKTKLGGQ